MSSNSSVHQVLDELFPVPSLPPSQLSPQRLPGANLDSAAALQDILKDNYQRHHIFLNDLHFHNHTTHRALAIYALGGTAAIIKDYYERDARNQRPAIQSPEPITEENFVEHLGDEKFYQGFVSFFSEQVSVKGTASTLEEFVFSEKYNFQKGRNSDAQPAMLSRFFESLMHALIHVGYGLEFGLKGMFVEGLALAAVHGVNVTGSFPLSVFTFNSTNIVKNNGTHLSSPAPVISKTGGVHAFDIITRILKDDRFNRRIPRDFANEYMEIFAEYSTMVREYAEKWTVDLKQPGEVERKVEELVWLSSLVYAVGGLAPNGFRSNFFLMHLVTSSLFLSSLIVYLSPRSQVLLLRSYLATVLTWWLMCGRPALNIKSFMTTTSMELAVPTSPTAGTPLSTETTSIPNPFLPILQSAITHPTDHVVKIQRAFAHFNTLYGRRPAGYFSGTELENAELLDGSLFLRASLLTADYVGWVREGKASREFSFEGF